jgi:hypothetical protein
MTTSPPHSPPREMRLTMRVLAYWRDICRGRDFPRASDIAPATVGEDWQHCLLIKVEPAAERSTFLFIGPALRVPQEPALEGQPLIQCPRKTLLGQATAYAASVVAKRVPISMGGAAVHLGASILYRSILLPVSTDGETIDGLLGAANFRAVPPNEQEHTA